MKSWCANYGLSLNDSKTKVIVFKSHELTTLLDLDVLNPVPSTPLSILGVIFHQYIMWDGHIDQIAKSASRRIHVKLKRLKDN